MIANDVDSADIRLCGISDPRLPGDISKSVFDKKKQIP